MLSILCPIGERRLASLIVIDLEGSAPDAVYLRCLSTFELI
jgi:hypothetical protein